MLLLRISCFVAVVDGLLGFIGMRVLTPEEIVEANENGKKVIVQLAFYSVFTILLSVCALYRCALVL
jgi:hypothetical protein